MAGEHARTLIRRAVKAQLVDQTRAETRVHTSQVFSWRVRDLPGVAVYTLSETVDPESHQTAPRELRRELRLAIEGAVVAGADVDDALDSLAREIERAMHGDERLGGTAAEAVLQGTEIMLFEDGEQLVGVVRLVYGVTYFTGAPEAEDVALDDLVTVDVRHNLGGAQDPGNQAHDVVTDLDE